MGVHQPQKFPSTKIRWKSSRLDFLLIKTASSSLIIFQRAKLSMRSIAHLCWFNWRTFGRKNTAGRSPRDLVLARKCPVSPGTCNPEETDIPGLPVSWSPTIFSGSGPFGLPPVPWTEKTIERSSFFVRRGVYSCRGDRVVLTKFWIFLSGLQKLEQRTKKWTELRWEYSYVE